MEDQGDKRIKAIENKIKKIILKTDKKSTEFFGKDFLNEEAKYQLNKLVEIENKVNKDDLICKISNNKRDKMYDIQKFKTIRLSVRERKL